MELFRLIYQRAVMKPEDEPVRYNNVPVGCSDGKGSKSPRCNQVLGTSISLDPPVFLKAVLHLVAGYQYCILYYSFGEKRLDDIGIPVTIEWSTTLRDCALQVSTTVRH